MFADMYKLMIYSLRKFFFMQQCFQKRFEFLYLGKYPFALRTPVSENTIKPEYTIGEIIYSMDEKKLHWNCF